MSKHTPGPWETNYTGNIWGDTNNPKHDGDHPLIGQIFKGSFEPQKSEPLTEEQRANAQLMIASPDLLAALSESESLINDAINILTTHLLPNTGRTNNDTIMLLLELFDGPKQRKVQTATRSAIAKTEEIH